MVEARESRGQLGDQQVTRRIAPSQKHIPFHLTIRPLRLSYRQPAPRRPHRTNTSGPIHARVCCSLALQITTAIARLRSHSTSLLDQPLPAIAHVFAVLLDWRISRDSCYYSQAEATIAIRMGLPRSAKTHSYVHAATRAALR